MTRTNIGNQNTICFFFFKNIHILVDKTGLITQSNVETTYPNKTSKQEHQWQINMWLNIHPHINNFANFNDQTVSYIKLCHFHTFEISSLHLWNKLSFNIQTQQHQQT